MTRPVGKAKVTVVGEAPTFAADLQRDLNRGIRQLNLDSGTLANKISSGAKLGAAASERALDGLANDVNDAFGKISREATQAFTHVSAAGAASASKVGASFQLGGEVSERALSELDRTSAREFQQIANKAGVSAASTSSRWVAAWSIIKGAALAATTASVAGLAAMTAFGLKSAGALEQTQIGLESLLGTADAAKSFIAELQTFAAATPFEFADVADASRRILAFGASVGIARKQVIPTLTTIGDLVSVLGGTSENVNSVIRALGQMASKGKVSQEEILQLSEALPGFNSNAAIASKLGLSVADTLTKITAGGVDARTGIDALLTGMANFKGASGAMAKQAQTLNGVFSTFKDTIAIALTDAFAPVIPTIKETLTQVTPIIGDAVKILAPILGQLLADALPLIGEAIKALSPILGIFVKLATTLLTAVAPAMQQLAPIVQRLLDGLQPLALAIGDVLAKALQELIDSGALDELVDMLLDLVPAVIDLLVALTPLLPVIAEMITLMLRSQRPGLQLLALITSLATKSTGLFNAAEAFTKLFRSIDQITRLDSDIRNWPKIFKAFGDKLGPVFDKAKAAVGDFFASVGRFFAELPGKIGSALSALPGKLVGALQAAFDAALKAVGFGIGLLIGAILAFPQLAVRALFALPGLLSTFLSQAWAIITTGARMALADVVGAFTGLVKLIGAAIAGVPATVAAVFSAAKDVVLRDINAIVSFLFSIPGRVTALGPQMVAAGLGLIRALFSGFNQAGGFVGDLAAGIARALKSLINKVISGINSGIESVDNALPGISLPRIPPLATGGLTTTGGLANLHPSELVLPLEDKRVIDLLARAMQVAAAGGDNLAPVGAGTPQFDVHVFIGQTELTHLVDTQISERNRTTTARVRAGTGRR